MPALFRLRVGLAQLRQQLVHAVQIAGDAAMRADFPLAPGALGYGNGDGLGMDIQPDMDY